MSDVLFLFGAVLYYGNGVQISISHIIIDLQLKIRFKGMNEESQWLAIEQDDDMQEDIRCQDLSGTDRSEGIRSGSDEHDGDADCLHAEGRRGGERGEEGRHGGQRGEEGRRGFIYIS